MTKSEFDTLIASASDEELLEEIWDYFPEEDVDGKFDGDAILVTQYASAEICNGGFFQFYGNGIFDPLNVIAKFEEMGAPDLADTVRRSMAVFPNSQPPVRGKGSAPIHDQLLALGVRHDSFDEIEQPFFDRQDDMAKIWADHVRSHPDKYWDYIEEGDQISS